MDDLWIWGIWIVMACDTADLDYMIFWWSMNIHDRVNILLEWGSLGQVWINTIYTYVQHRHTHTYNVSSWSIIRSNEGFLIFQPETSPCWSSSEAIQRSSATVPPVWRALSNKRHRSSCRGCGFGWTKLRNLRKSIKHIKHGRTCQTKMTFNIFI